MTPTQIALVTDTWRRGRPRLPLLLEAVAATLPAAEGGDRAERAARILDAVERLHPLLPHPAALEREAAALVGEWAAWTLARRSETEAALLTGLTVAVGPLTPEADGAWRAALDLFHEILAELVLRPFGPPLPGHGQRPEVRR